jgi:hypothetical protein
VVFFFFFFLDQFDINVQYLLKMAPQKVEEEGADNGFTETLDDKLEKVRHHQNSKLVHQHRVCIVIVDQLLWSANYWL